VCDNPKATKDDDLSEYKRGRKSMEGFVCYIHKVFLRVLGVSKGFRVFEVGSLRV
jgi:hypothetical protein